MATSTMSRSSGISAPFTDRSHAPTKKNKKEARTDIWTGLLKQTHEAQTRRSRTSAMQNCSLLVCGGDSAADQRAFVQTLARPPPSSTQQARNQDRGKQPQRGKGELRLSNTYAYGYGHMTLYLPPAGQVGGVLSAEAEEAARLLIHTIPSPDKQFVPLMRRLLANEQTEKKEDPSDDLLESEREAATAEEEAAAQNRIAVCILLSWKQPWKFMGQLRDWLQLFAQALLPPEGRATDPMDILKDSQLPLTIVVQHTEAQEDLFREGYKEEDFDYISQCLRTAVLPLHPHSALVYMSATTPPQQPATPLTEQQKVIFSSLGLNLAALSPKPARSANGESTTVKKEEFGPKHEFMDRMAIVIPAGWDSAAFIRTLSETFSPEDVLNAWLNDLQPPPLPSPEPTEQEIEQKEKHTGPSANEEVYASSSPINDSFSVSPPLSPSKQVPSTILQYENKVLNPQAHKVQPTGPPPIEVTTKPTQSFLAEMRTHLQELEAQDRDRNADASSASTTRFSGRGAIGMPGGEQSGALDELGDVSFNVGGVSYDAGRAIERLKRPPLNLSGTMSSDSGPLSPGSRVTTPKPRAAAHATPRLESTPSLAPGSGIKDLPVDKLEEYFASLMKKGAGGVSRDGTPTRSRGAAE